MAYIDLDDVKRSLPTGFDNTTVLPDADITDLIGQADDKVDAQLAAYYFPFNAHGSATHPTPDIVKQASRKIATGMALRQLGNVYNTEDAERGQLLIEEGLADALVLVSGDVQLKLNSTTGEALTWGTGSPSWGLQTDEAFLASTSPLDSGDPPHILTDTVRIDGGSGVTGLTNMRNGTEFSVCWEIGYQRYVLKAHTSDLTGATSPTVAYEWDYRRMRGDSNRWNGALASG